MKFTIAFICGLLSLVLTAPANAQSYPNKPVRVVVPYPPGGPTDIVARVLFQQVSEATGQQFLVDNRAGAGGNIGAEIVAKSPADGYTLLIGTTAHAINMSLFKNLSYDVQKDFAPVSLLTQGPLVLVAHPQFPANSIKEVIELAKSKSGGLNFASSGNGQSTHLSAELFNTMAGIKMSHVPYKGSAPALTDVMSGQVDVMFDTTLSAMPFVKAGKLKALAVFASKRTELAPEIPTLRETGIPSLFDVTVDGWTGIFAPQGTPVAVVNFLNQEINKVLEDPEFKKRANGQSLDVYTPSTPAQFTDYVRSEYNRWSAVIKPLQIEVN